MIAGLTEKELEALLLAELSRVLEAEFAPLIARIERMGLRMLDLRQMLDRMNSDNAATVRRFARDISARLDALEAGEVVMPMLRRPAAVVDLSQPVAYQTGYKAARACSDAIWARVDELAVRVRALIEARPKPRVRVQ